MQKNEHENKKYRIVHNGHIYRIEVHEPGYGWFFCDEFGFKSNHFPLFETRFLWLARRKRAALERKESFRKAASSPIWQVIE